MRIVLTGGGTGGHLFPLIAVAKEIKKLLGGNANILFIGSDGNIEREVFTRENIPVKHVLSGKKRRYFSWLNFVDPLKIPLGIVQALWILLWYMPDAVFSKGGYASIPVVIAAWLYRIPILIHESDAAAGTANRKLAKLAKRIAVSYPEAEQFFPREKSALTGNPVRPDIASGSSQMLREKYELTISKPIILVLGGSQGSRVINKAIVRILPHILPRAQIIHQTGENNYEEVVRSAAELGIKAGHEGYVPIGFMDIEMMKNALAAADLIISRAGANAISEIAANSKPVILVPLEDSANDHQRLNAYSLARIGAALVLEENNLGENLLYENVINLLDNEKMRRNMGEKIKVFYHPDAARKIAEAVIEIAS